METSSVARPSSLHTKTHKGRRGITRLAIFHNPQVIYCRTQCLISIPRNALISPPPFAGAQIPRPSIFPKNRKNDLFWSRVHAASPHLTTVNDAKQDPIGPMEIESPNILKLSRCIFGIFSFPALYISHSVWSKNVVTQMTKTF